MSRATAHGRTMPARARAGSIDAHAPTTAARSAGLATLSIAPATSPSAHASTSAAHAAAAAPGAPASAAADAARTSAPVRASGGGAARRQRSARASAAFTAAASAPHGPPCRARQHDSTPEMMCQKVPVCAPPGSVDAHRTPWRAPQPPHREGHARGRRASRGVNNPARDLAASARDPCVRGRLTLIHPSALRGRQAAHSSRGRRRHGDQQRGVPAVRARAHVSARQRRQRRARARDGVRESALRRPGPRSDGEAEHTSSEAARRRRRLAGKRGRGRAGARQCTRGARDRGRGHVITTAGGQHLQAQRGPERHGDAPEHGEQSRSRARLSGRARDCSEARRPHRAIAAAAECSGCRACHGERPTGTLRGAAEHGGALTMTRAARAHLVKRSQDCDCLR